MAKASARVELPATADAVWAVIGGFGSLPDWLSFIPTSELTEGGRVRQLSSSDGRVIVERLMAFDEKARSYTYHIMQSPFPVRDYYSTLTVKPALEGGGAVVEWSGAFTPVTVSEAEAAQIFQQIYETGLMSLSERMGR